MSASLDLNGATVTLLQDSVNSYYQITDTSTNHDGTLIVSAGASIVFDDTSGAGFAAAASGITITVDGNADSPCTIKSASTKPTNRWNMPASSTIVTITRCTIFGYTGGISSPSWILNNVTFLNPLDLSPRADIIKNTLFQTCTIEPFGGYDSNGQATYGNGRIVSCSVFPLQRREFRLEGDIQTAVGSVIILPADDPVTDRDRITINDHQDREPIVAQVDFCRDLFGKLEHKEVRF